MGEIRRVLNSFLQFLEQDDSDSLVIAATNLEGILDEALFRRFDDVITYHLPDEQELGSLIANRLSAFDISSRDIKGVVGHAAGLSHADVCRACDDAAKLAVLKDRRKIDAKELLNAIQVRGARRRPN